jgi:hypothetical protein
LSAKDSHLSAKTLALKSERLALKSERLALKSGELRNVSSTQSIENYRTRPVHFILISAFPFFFFVIFTPCPKRFEFYGIQITPLKRIFVFGSYMSQLVFVSLQQHAVICFAMTGTEQDKT